MSEDKSSDLKNTPVSKKTGIMKFFTSQTETPVSNDVKLFPIFSRTPASKTTPVSPDIKLEKDERGQSRESKGNSGTDHVLCSTIGSIIEAKSNSKKLGANKRKRNSFDDDQTKCSQEATLEAQLSKSSEESSALLNLKRTNVLSSPENCIASTLYPIFNNSSSGKKRGRKPGSKVINGSVISPQKKRGRPRKQTSLTEEGNSDTLAIKVPKKRGRKPGSSLLKRLNENLAQPFEDLTGSPRKRQKVDLFCAGVDEVDASDSDDASVMSISLSSDESSTSNSNKKVSVAVALNNMMKSYKNKKSKESHRSLFNVEGDSSFSNAKESLLFKENELKLVHHTNIENPASGVEVCEKTIDSSDSDVDFSKDLKPISHKETRKTSFETSSTPESKNIKSRKNPTKKEVEKRKKRISSHSKNSTSSSNDESSSSLEIAEVICSVTEVQDKKCNSFTNGSKNSKSNGHQNGKLIKSTESLDNKLFPLFTKKQTLSSNIDSKSGNVPKKDIDTPNKNKQLKKPERNLRMEKDKKIQEEPIGVELVSIESSLDSGTDLKSSDSKKTTLENHSAQTKVQDPITSRKTMSKSYETQLSFPLQTHFNAAISTEKSVECEKLLTEIERPETLVQIPIWTGIAGLTSIKSLKQAKSLRKNCKTPKRAVKVKELVDSSLWTDIESEYDLKEGVSESTISELNLWLQMWKSKLTKNVKKTHKGNEDSSDSFSSNSDYSDEEENSNGIIIMGPPGSGKTSLVFSLAAKHGFKVLEVNASSCRSGRNVSNQLKEALESYHVENTKMPESSTTMFDSKPSGKSVKESSQKTSKKGILNFLKSNEGGSKNSNSSQTKESPASKGKKSLKKEKHLKSKKTDQESTKDASCTISGQTIILFDDIDVVFEEDEGLWSTIRGFLKISKKPVIFTVSRNLELVRNNIDLDIQVLYLKPMIKEVAFDKLISQCKKYGRDDTNVNIGNLLPCYSNDLRRSLLHAQFWSQSLPNQKTTSPNNLVDSLSINTFGSAGFTATDLSSMISNGMYDDISLALSRYHKIGYDILHCNLYPLFNIASALEVSQNWNVRPETKACIEENSEDDSAFKGRKTKTDTKSNLWQEACEMFESKRKSLQNGSCSSDLSVFADIIEDFSFSDLLKGMATEEMNWLSIPERVKRWNLGRPVCSDLNIVYKDFIPEMISMIQILSIQIGKGRPLKCKLDKNRKDSLVLLHPFTTELDFKIENILDCIASALPPNLLLNKTVLKMDYLSILKLICHKESERQIDSGKRSNRFLHYFDSISLLIDKYQIEQILDNF